MKVHLLPFRQTLRVFLIKERLEAVYELQCGVLHLQS